MAVAAAAAEEDSSMAVAGEILGGKGNEGRRRRGLGGARVSACCARVGFDLVRLGAKVLLLRRFGCGF
jgi:hypothetical protein